MRSSLSCYYLLSSLCKHLASSDIPPMTNTVLPYIDDILIASSNAEVHKHDLIDRLRTQHIKKKSLRLNTLLSIQDSWSQFYLTVVPRYVLFYYLIHQHSCNLFWGCAIIDDLELRFMYKPAEPLYDLTKTENPKPKFQLNDDQLRVSILLNLHYAVPQPQVQ